MEFKEKVTVIVPVYKIEKYLTRCVDSILSQTYTNLEIFLVDDGSPDSCPAICDQYAQKDNRIKVIHKENGGLSSARNVALDKMSGQYVTFVDSDDWIEPTYVEELYCAIKERDCDISVCFDTFYDEDGVRVDNKDFTSFNEYRPKDECYDLFYRKSSSKARVTAWGKLYKKDIFKELRYPDGVVFEDAYVLPDILSSVKVGIVVIDSPLYNYLINRKGNITTSINEKAFDEVTSRRRACELFDKTKSYYPYAVKELFFSYIFLYGKVKKSGNKEFKKRFEVLFKKDYRDYHKYLPREYKGRFVLFRYYRWLYVFLKKVKGLIKRA